MNNDPIIITRQQVGRWASYIGGTALLLGVLGWLWNGGISPLVAGLLIGGGIGIALWASFIPAEFVAFITGRSVRFGTSAVFSTLLLIGIVVLTYIFVARATLTLDMTQGRRFSLSPVTLDVLSNVTRPMRLIAFYNAGGIAMREVDDQFFRLYEVATNGRITRQYVDPDIEPALAQRFGAFSNGATFLAYLTSEGEIDFATLARVPRQEGGAQEREITQAISRMLLAGTFTVYFEVGHGGPDPLDTSQQGLSGIHAGMQESGLITGALDLRVLAANNQDVPDDASAIIIAGPTIPFSQPVIAVLDRYLARGGRLFIMADAQFSDDPFLAEDSAFNQYLWERFGMRALDAVVVDPAASMQTPLDIIGAAAYTGTSLTARLDPAEAPTLFRLARALEVNPDPPVSNGRVFDSSPISYGETNLRLLGETNTYQFDAGQDIQGPLTLVAWAWDETTGARILLTGDSDFVRNGFVSSALGNAVLLTDGVAWLTGLQERVTFPPRAFPDVPLLFIDGQTLDLIAFFTVIVMPVMTLILGFGIWMRRVRR